MPIDLVAAQEAARGWLNGIDNPFQAFPAKPTVRAIQAYSEAAGENLFFVAQLTPSGFLIISGNDEMEPIVAFSGRGIFTADLNHPLGALTHGDLTARQAALRRGQPTRLRQACQEKWRRLRSLAGAVQKRGRTELVDDLRVAPLIASAWDQQSEGSALCYNYWTPNHYPCGCMATALAQLMRLHRHPPIGVGTAAFTIQVDGNSQSRALMGGDGAGGPYVWDWMTLDPDENTPATNRMEIGALCHDISVAAGSKFTASYTSTGFTAAFNALRNTFFYSQAVIGYNNNTNIGAVLNTMLNPGLDAGYPSVLGIFNDGGGHAVLCDGYGYVAETLYHHLNLGWGASSAADNVWYALPNVDTSAQTYSVIKICAYNIFVYGTGEIISGRITDSYGVPIAEAALTLAVSNGPTLTTLSDANGIYAFSALPSDRYAAITVTKAGYYFSSQTVRIGKSKNEQAVCGNLWQVDFAGQVSRLPVQEDYDGDSRADFGWYNASNGAWKIWLSGQTNEDVQFTFGGTGDYAVPADYDGDGRADPAIYNPAAQRWTALLSSCGYQSPVSITFGGNNWQAVPADYDGDGRADPAVYQINTGYWQALLSADAYRQITTPTPCGGSGWLAAPADYDGDGRFDPAVCKTNGAWKAWLSASGYTMAAAVLDATPLTQIVPADYDGDNRADPAVYNAASGAWTLYLSGNDYNPEQIAFGGAGQIAAPADYDGDSRADLGLYEIAGDTWSYRPATQD